MHRSRFQYSFPFEKRHTNRGVIECKKKAAIFPRDKLRMPFIHSTWSLIPFFIRGRDPCRFSGPSAAGFRGVYLNARTSVLTPSVVIRARVMYRPLRRTENSKTVLRLVAPDAALRFYRPDKTVGALCIVTRPLIFVRLGWLHVNIRFPRGFLAKRTYGEPAVFIILYLPAIRAFHSLPSIILFSTIRPQ